MVFYSLYVKSCADLKLYTRLMFKTILTWSTWDLIFLLLVSTETQKHARFVFGPFPSFQGYIIINVMQHVVDLLRSRVVSGAPSGHNYVRISIYFSQFRLFLCLHYELSFWSWQIISFTSLFMSYSWATITARFTSNAFQKIQITVQPSWKLHTLDQVC